MEEPISKDRMRTILRKFSRYLLKYIPYWMCLLYTVFCLFRALGCDQHFIVTFFGSCGFFWMIFIYIASLEHGFCKWHRYLLLYDFIVWLMIYHEMWVGFGHLRRPLNWLFFVIGFALSTIVSVRIYRKEYCNE